MEVDRISYIFGSFSRRKSSSVGQQKRRSIEPPKTLQKEPKSSDDVKFKCPLCHKYYIEPRVLPCLHTFCTKCLLQLEKQDVWINGSDENSSSHNGSGGSGYVSDKHENSDSECSQVRAIVCPTCGIKYDINEEGINTFPLHYLIQHRLVLATLNAPSTNLLCDICSADVTATVRCNECAISLCPKCGDVHLQHKDNRTHQVFTLDEARRKGITKVRRQLMCNLHLEKELLLFCSTCLQVICNQCSIGLHKSHQVEPAMKAAKTQTTNIRIAVGRARSIAEKSLTTAAQLDSTTKRIETKCDQIQKEIELFAESYIKAVEEHHRNLHQQLNNARNEKLRIVELQRNELLRRLKDTKDAVSFVDELLKDGTDVEILSFFKSIMDRLEFCYKADGIHDIKVSESLQFLPEELAESEDACCPLYGVVTTQTISIKHCLLHQDGLSNLRVGRRAEAIVETRDRTDNPLQRGGELITAEVKHRDVGSSRLLNVNVEDRRDGTYLIRFIPDIAGKLSLTVFIKGQPMKDCPITLSVRTLRPHHGTFHCCTFCSSGGSKGSTCGCGGNMPGGYMGCGHGHDGHPGRRHWSCCGNVLEHSECIRTNSILAHYQYTL